MKKCSHCGVDNPDSNSFCGFCGKPLTNSPAGESAGGSRLRGNMGKKTYSGTGTGQTDSFDPEKTQLAEHTPSGGSRLQGTMGGKTYSGTGAAQENSFDPKKTPQTEHTPSGGSRLQGTMGGNHHAGSGSTPADSRNWQGSSSNSGSTGNIPSGDSRLQGNLGRNHHAGSGSTPADSRNWQGSASNSGQQQTYPGGGSRSSGYDSGSPRDPEEYVFCTSCGSATPAGSTFCAKCGRPMKKEQRQRKSPVPILVGLLAAVLLLALLGFFLLRGGSGNRVEETLPTQTIPAETKPRETTPTQTKPTETVPAQTEPAQTAPTETTQTQSEVPLWQTDPFNSKVWRSNLMTPDPLGVFDINKELIASVEFRITQFDFTMEDVTWNLGKDSSQRVIGKVEWYNSKAHVIIAANGAINGELCAAGLFEGCTNLEAVYGLEALRVMDATSLDRMFYGCQNLTYISFNGPSWNTSKITSMSEMFRECMLLTDDNFAFLKYWDTSNVTSMYAMFSTCNNLERLDLSMFDTSRVTNMGYMFSACRRLKQVDVSSFNTSRVTNMEGMFRWCNELEEPDLSGWDVSKVTNSSGFMNDGMTINGQPWKEFFK